MGPGLSESQAAGDTSPEQQCVVRQTTTNNEMTLIYREGLRNPGGTPGTPPGPNPLLHYNTMAEN